MSDNKYDVVTLIELIETKPCLWDKTCEDNKNKIVRDRSWQEVFEYMEDGYSEMTQQEKKKTGDMIMKKWANVRDSFMRSLRCGTGQAAKKKYMYSDHLMFLLKTGKKAETVNNFDVDVGGDANDEDSNVTDIGLQRDDDLTVNFTEPVTSAGTSTGTSTGTSAGTSASQKVFPNTSKTVRKRQLDPIEREILKEIRDDKTPKLTAPPSDHEMIVSSFLPHIRDLTASELLDFQVQTLTLIQSIKKQRVSIPLTFNITSDDGSSSASYQVQSPSPGTENNFQNVLLLCSTEHKQ